MAWAIPLKIQPQDIMFTRSSLMSSRTTFAIPEQVSQRMEAIQSNGKRIVVMTYGLSGSGKSTLARNLTQLPWPFIRLSIDAVVLQSHGTYDSASWTPVRIGKYQDIAESVLMTHLRSLLRQGNTDVVLDLSFYSKQWRDEMRGFIEEEGGGRYEVLLVLFIGDGELIWERLEKRNLLFERRVEERRELEGLPISKEMLRGWISGFEWPDGEGEVVVKVE